MRISIVEWRSSNWYILWSLDCFIVYLSYKVRAFINFLHFSPPSIYLNFSPPSIHFKKKNHINGYSRNVLHTLRRGSKNHQKNLDGSLFEFDLTIIE